MEELKEQQNRIEQKLDLLLLALAQHPEFGNMVKEGKRKAYYEAKREELQKKLKSWKSAKKDFMLEALNRGFAPDLEGHINSLSSGLLTKSEVAERRLSIFNAALEDTSNYPITQKYLDRTVGPEPDVDGELNKLMLEYAKNQENI